MENRSPRSLLKNGHNSSEGNPYSHSLRTGRGEINYSSLNQLGKRARQENGLVELTKKFIDLLRNAPDQCVDLN